MTTESTQPQTELGPASATGQAQAQQGQAQPQAAPQAPPVAQAAAPPPPQKAMSQGHQGHQGQGQGQGQGRKKKKFFQKGSGGPAQPGNNMAAHSPGNSHAGSQGKRKGKQRGPREFVGPMDHSYRAANGNIADGPPSTIQITSNNGHGGGYYQEAYAPPAAAAAVRDDAPTRIFCFIDDLFFQAKINETSKKLGVKVEFVKNDKESVAKLTDVAEADRPALVVFDLNNLNAKPLTLIPKIKTKLKKATSIIGFLNHLQGDLKLKAIEAGCDTVMPRSAFSQSLPNLLRRYGLEEEEDNYQQPM